MYDLSDFTTFERMMLYYDSLIRKFKLNEKKLNVLLWEINLKKKCF